MKQGIANTGNVNKKRGRLLKNSSDPQDNEVKKVEDLCKSETGSSSKLPSARMRLQMISSSFSSFKDESL